MHPIIERPPPRCNAVTDSISQSPPLPPPLPPPPLALAHTPAAPPPAAHSHLHDQRQAVVSAEIGPTAMTASWNAITGPTAALQSTIAEIQRAVLEPIRTAWHCVDSGSHSAAIRHLRGRCRGRPGPSAGPVASLPRDQGRPLSFVHHRRPRLCAASKQACERLPRQHETAAACGVSATNRQGGRVGLV